LARVLFLTQLLPYPLVSGAKIRAYYVLRYLATKHQVTLLSFVRPDDRSQDVAHLERFLETVHTVPIQRSWLRNVRAGAVGLATGRPMTIVREEIGVMQRRVRQLLANGNFDVVHADQIPMAQYGLLAPDAGGKRLLDQHNATFRLVGRLARNEPRWWMRQMLQREAGAFARYEADVCQRYDYVSFVAEEDRRDLLAHMPSGALAGRNMVIPICVEPQAVQSVIPSQRPWRVTHIGTMFWPPNAEGVVWFWEEVWPQVRAQMPQSRLTIIGKNPPQHIQALDKNRDVDVLGFVDDLSPYLAETAVFIVPLLAGGGMRVKILDAWSWGLPIVSTSVGAEGIAFRQGEQILIADTPQAFARATCRLVDDPALRERLRANGRAWLEDRYDWQRVYPVWDEVYARLLGGI
jgi:glycosyltransferase involved in cell wall biosynthesis